MLQKTQNLDVVENLSSLKRCKVGLTFLGLVLNLCGTAVQNQHGIYFSSEVFSCLHITDSEQECQTLAVCTFSLPVRLCVFIRSTYFIEFLRSK